MKYLRISIVLMITSYVLGIVSGLTIHPEVADEFVRELSKELRPIMESLSINPLIAALLIFINNLRVALISFFLGPTLLIPILVLFTNGYVLGTYLTYSPYTPTYNLLLILPHGALELPAILMSASLGTSLSLALISKYLMRRRDIAVRQLLVKYVKYLIPITLILAIAAFVEVFITPLIPVILGITS